MFETIIELLARNAASPDPASTDDRVATVTLKYPRFDRSFEGFPTVSFDSAFIHATATLPPRGAYLSHFLELVMKRSSVFRG